MRHIHTNTHCGLGHRHARVAGRYFLALTFFAPAVAGLDYTPAQIPIDLRAD
jgi:hypothetical protein